MFSVPSKPGVIDRSTLEDRDQQKRKAISNAQNYRAVAAFPKEWLREDSKIKHNDRDFHHRQGGQIQILVEIIDLQQLGDVRERKSPDVFPESKVRHFRMLQSAVYSVEIARHRLTNFDQYCHCYHLKHSDRENGIIPS